ncbi:hypothetical protein QAD02_005798 [Eretmocerus hayati]|uniref:Uncharacterized protein n=1 Tax=Eretmocerus hayati TaxID=131215 RepID=A0ACC2NUM7_9HYME|nr:hypothetical protein QAD02_005798 [Eretmocerus hayati]
MSVPFSVLVRPNRRLVQESSVNLSYITDTPKQLVFKYRGWDPIEIPNEKVLNRRDLTYLTGSIMQRTNQNQNSVAVCTGTSGAGKTDTINGNGLTLSPQSLVGRYGSELFASKGVETITRAVIKVQLWLSGAPGGSWPKRDEVPTPSASSRAMRRPTQTLRLKIDLKIRREQRPLQGPVQRLAHRHPQRSGSPGYAAGVARALNNMRIQYASSDERNGSKPIKRAILERHASSLRVIDFCPVFRRRGEGKVPVKKL